MNMLTCAIILAAGFVQQAKLEPEHARNDVYAQVLKDGLKSGAETVTLPSPRLIDGQGAAAERAALREVAGSDEAVEALLRKSVTAPFILKVPDHKTSGATIRSADLWFVVYADLKQVDFAKEAGRTDQKEVEVANMWFQTGLLKAEDIKNAGVKPAEAVPDQSEWFSYVHGKLLDRIDFEATNRVVASQTADSIVIASRTDPSFGKATAHANAWKPLAKGDAPTPDEAKKPYEGGISYAKISRLAMREGALLVEMHMAFVEPDGWFQGAPILRSKFNIAAQDRIRSLRRELARKQAK
jgi:hypothetical protein